MHLNLMSSFRMRTLCKVHQYWAWFYRKRCFIVLNGIPELYDNYISKAFWRRMCSRSCVNLDSDVNLKNELLKPYVRSLLKEYNESLLKGRDALKLVTDVEKIMKIVDLIQSFKVVESSIHSLQEMKKDASDDENFIKSVNEELSDSEKELTKIEEKLIAELIPTDEDHYSDIIVEISAGIGGQEAMLFAKDLHDMYYKYFNFLNWKYELSDYDFSDIGGLRTSSFLVSGTNSFKILQFEGGVHRVQRIPKTDNNGRMHTSTVSVAVYPQPSSVDVQVNNEDVKFETKTARGPGGQHVNKIQTAVRLHHLPTGIIVECQTLKSQSENKKIAYRKLYLKLFQLENEKRNSIIRHTRKSQIKSKSRNEKVRTYNYTQDRITDHRFRKSIHNISKYLEGGAYFHDFLLDLQEVHYNHRKKEFFEKLKTFVND